MTAHLLHPNMTGPMCHHDANAPDFGCSGCRRWHSRPGYRDIIRTLPATAAGALKAARLSAPLPPPTPPRVLRVDVPADGPGTELLALFEGWEIHKVFPACVACKQMALQMNRWGAAGCRLPDNFRRIADHLRAAAKKVGWLDRVRAMAKAAPHALREGVVLNPADPCPGLVEEAIRRAEAREKSGAAPDDRRQ